MNVPSIARFCISHEEPLLPQSWFDYCISLGDYQCDSVGHISKLDKFWHEARPIAYGAAGMHALPAAVAKFAPVVDLVEISCYRKRILRSPEGRPSKLYMTMQELSPETASERHDLEIVLPMSESGFLLAQPLFFRRTIAKQYAAAHHRRDLRDYVSLAVELEILDGVGARELLDGLFFIPGGAQLGVYPRKWLLSILSKMDLLGREFLRRYSNRLQKYDLLQVRAIGFLEERLGSYLLLRHLDAMYSGSIPAEVFGFMTTILADGVDYAPSRAV